MRHQVHQIKEPNCSYKLQDNFRLCLDLKNSKEKERDWQKCQIFLFVCDCHGKQDEIWNIEENREKDMHSETPNFLYKKNWKKSEGNQWYLSLSLQPLRS